MLELRDQWVWDFWLTKDEKQYYCYFLKANKSLDDPDLRHFNVSQGLAVSHDLISWDYKGTVLSPSTSPNFDDYTTWTGSVLKKQNQWHYFYTGGSKKEDGKLQRIGHAVGSTPYSFARVGNGLALDLDANIYEEYTPGFWHDRSLRDPWVMINPNGNGYIMAYTARVSISKQANECGAIGLARSDDLNNWAALPPLYQGSFGQLEVPQIFNINNRWYCLFCTRPEDWSNSFRNEYNGKVVKGTHYLIADSFDGPWQLAPGPLLTSNSSIELYAGKVIYHKDKYVFMGFLHDDEKGNFVGKISNPLDLSVKEDGLLEIIFPE
tara:strand:+ start:690 stop:1655 length:966 start_codon:yes stop_codon:yes gene_type:complete